MSSATISSQCSLHSELTKPVSEELVVDSIRVRARTGTTSRSIQAADFLGLVLRPIRTRAGTTSRRSSSSTGAPTAYCASSDGLHCWSPVGSSLRLLVACRSPPARLGGGFHSIPMQAWAAALEEPEPAPHPAVLEPAAAAGSRACSPGRGGVSGRDRHGSAGQPVAEPVCGRHAVRRRGPVGVRVLDSAPKFRPEVQGRRGPAGHRQGTGLLRDTAAGR